MSENRRGDFFESHCIATVATSQSSAIGQSEYMASSAVQCNADYKNLYGSVREGVCVYL